MTDKPKVCGECGWGTSISGLRVSTTCIGVIIIRFKTDKCRYPDKFKPKETDNEDQSRL